MNNHEMKEVMLHILYSMVCLRQGGQRCADHGEAFVKWCQSHTVLIEQLLTATVVHAYGNSVLAESKRAITNGLAEKFIEKIGESLPIAA